MDKGKDKAVNEAAMNYKGMKFYHHEGKVVSNYKKLKYLKYKVNSFAKFGTVGQCMVGKTVK